MKSLLQRIALLFPLAALAAAPLEKLGFDPQKEPDKAAAAYFAAEAPERSAALEAASKLERGRLSPAGVERLYGRKLRLSASRIESFSSCRFSYFCQYGLKAKPYEPAGFQPPEIGTFMHAVLEDVARQVKELGGFPNLDDEQVKSLTAASVENYVHR